jgi:methionyl-tRNA formyltransferase
MKIVFFGTSSFSAQVLECLSSLPHEILAVVTRPDRPQGRDLRLKPSPVKAFSLAHLSGALVLEPEKASDASFCDQLKSLEPDLFLVVAYGQILKQNLLSVPKKACVNIHTSLLPKYRGAAPMQRCLMSGDAASGVTFMEMAVKMDAGDILKQDVVPITPNMNHGELEEALLASAKRCLPEFLLHFDEYYAHKKAQDEALVSIAPKITAEDCVICWNRPVQQVHDQIRALSPSPGVFIQLQFGEKIKRLKILASKPLLSPASVEAGVLYVDREMIKISCQDGFLVLSTVQLEGKKAMQAEEFLRGVSKNFSLVS